MGIDLVLVTEEGESEVYERFANVPGFFNLLSVMDNLLPTLKEFAEHQTAEPPPGIPTIKSVYEWFEAFTSTGQEEALVAFSRYTEFCNSAISSFFEEHPEEKSQDLTGFPVNPEDFSKRVRVLFGRLIFVDESREPLREGDYNMLYYFTRGFMGVITAVAGQYEEGEEEEFLDALAHAYSCMETLAKGLEKSFEEEKSLHFDC